MCIICNLRNPSDPSKADAFLNSFRRAGDDMRLSEAALLEVADLVDDESAKQYRKLHKRMVRLRKSWNRIEQEREVRCAEHAATPA